MCMGVFSQNKTMLLSYSFNELIKASGILFAELKFYLNRLFYVFKTKPSKHFLTITPLNYFEGKNDEKENINF